MSHRKQLVNRKFKMGNCIQHYLSNQIGNREFTLTNIASVTKLLAKLWHNNLYPKLEERWKTRKRNGDVETKISSFGLFIYYQLYAIFSTITFNLSLEVLISFQIYHWEIKVRVSHPSQSDDTKNTYRTADYLIKHHGMNIKTKFQNLTIQSIVQSLCIYTYTCIRFLFYFFKEITIVHSLNILGVTRKHN